MKKFIIEQNVWDGMSGGGSGDADAPPTPTIETTGEDNAGALDKNFGQDGVEH